MQKIEELADKSWQVHTNPETSLYECFFHYEDKMVFNAGFTEGYKAALPMAYFVTLWGDNNPTTMTDEEFITEAMREEKVFTLLQLQEMWCWDNLPNQSRTFLRIL